MLEWNLKDPAADPVKDETETGEGLVSMMKGQLEEPAEPRRSNRFDDEAPAALQFSLPMRPEEPPEPVVEADEFTVEHPPAFHEAPAPAPVPTAVRRPRRSNARVRPEREPGRSSSSTWYRPERVLVAMLLVNFLVMTILVGLPSESDQGPRVDDAAETVLPASAGATPGIERQTTPVAPAVGLPDPQLYQAGQDEIRAGNYERGRAMLERYLATHPGLDAVHLQTVFSSLAYCARKQGLSDDAAAYLAAIENLRQSASSPDELLAAAERARLRGQNGRARMLYSRILLQQSTLPEEWLQSGKLDVARVGFGLVLANSSEEKVK